MNTKIRPIRNEEDYNAMVALVDQLIDAEPGSADYDSLQVASDLVWAWEQQHVEMLPPDPIEAIKFRLEQMGLSLRDLRPLIGSDARVSEVMSGKRDLTLKMVRALHHHLGIPLESLVHERSLEPGSDVNLDNYPIHEGMKLGWTPRFSDPRAGYEEEAFEDLRERGDASSFELALCRQNSNAYANAKTDPFALYYWCLHVRAVAREETLGTRYRPQSISENLFHELAHLSDRADGPMQAKKHLEAVGVHLVAAKHMRGTFLDGAAILLGDGSPVIGMTLRHDRLDNFWHCLLHELAHIKLHLGRQGSPTFFHDDFDVKGELDTVEAQADQLAAEALLPHDALSELGNLKFVSTGDINGLAEEYGVHPAIVAGRVRYETGNYAKFAKLLGHGEPKKILGVTW